MMLHASQNKRAGHSSPVTVMGAGAWGSMIALLLAHNTHVTLWARREEHAAEMNRTRRNEAYVPGLELPAAINITSDLEKATADTNIVFMAVPSTVMREVLPGIPKVPGLVSCAKGLELGSFKRLTEVIAEYQPQAMLAALSGPNLAREIAAGLPTAATVASTDEAFASQVQGYLNGSTFRVYTSTDIAGVEVGGAIKNIIALAAGMGDGLGLGDNAKATLITRGLAEMMRLGTHLGGDPKTFFGLAGLGDLVATCSSASSRNHTAGVRIAQGTTRQDLEASRLTAEGIPTVRAVVDYAERSGLELPIAREVYRVIFEGKPALQALEDLMRREPKAEWPGQ